MEVRRWAETFAGGAVSAGMARLNARYPWSHNDHFHGWIIANRPKPCRAALDVGCGRGELVAALAPHVARVVGNDIDETMREQAAGGCEGLPNVTIVGGDWTRDEETHDLVVMVAVLHHLDAAETLREVRRRLTPGGRFLAVGLAPPRTLRGHLWDAASMVTNPFIGYLKRLRRGTTEVQPPPPFPVREPTLSFDELRLLLNDQMPGAEIRHRLGFRHTIAWSNPR